MDTDDGAMKRLALAVLLLSACGESPRDSNPWVSDVVSFSPGPGAGFGQDQMPHVVLGPPETVGVSQGSLDVVSLGVAGQIVLDMGEPVLDVEGPDFVVFENAFVPQSAPDTVFAEYGLVEVSLDGQAWVGFACEPPEQILGCAGWHPTADFDATAPLDAASCGGDQFDLAQAGVASFRYLRITDLSTSGAAPTAGFDLDAVGRLD